MTPVADEQVAFEEAVRCLLYDLWSSEAESDAVRSLLQGSWVGNQLAGMSRHHRIRQAAHRAHQQSQAVDQARQEENRQLRQERHQQRLALKTERDRLWRERQGKPD